MDRIGPYVVERELGRQGIAMLFAVRRDGTGPLEILRRLHNRRATEPQSRLRFERETTLAQELSSPYLVRVEDSGVGDDDVPYAVLEFFEGRSLSQFLAEDAQLAQRDAAILGRQIALALSTLGGAGIVLRSLDPRSIIVTPDGTIRIMEFGQALVEGQPLETGPGLVVARTHYMPPEQIVRGNVGPGADLFALGVILYEMLTSDSPFGAEEPPLQVDERVRAGARDVRGIRPEIHHELAGLVDALLAYDPEARPSASDVASRLEQWTERREDLADVAPTTEGTAGVAAAQASVQSPVHVDATADAPPESLEPAAAEVIQLPAPARRSSLRSAVQGAVEHREPDSHATTATQSWRRPPAPPTGAMPGAALAGGGLRLTTRRTMALAAVVAAVAVVAVGVALSGGGDATPDERAVGTGAASEQATNPPAGTASSTPPAVTSVALELGTVGQGSIRQDPPGVDLESGTQVQLVAEPAEGWRFDAWQGDLAGSEATLVIDLDADLSAQAIFLRDSWNLTVQTTGDGSIAALVDDAAPLTLAAEPEAIADGAALELFATPADGWRFAGWTGAVALSNDSISFVVDSDLVLTATFEQIRWAIAASVEGSGSVELSPSAGDLPQGTQVQAVALPDAGWRFVRWDSGASGSEATVSLELTADVAFIAVFEPIPPPAPTRYSVGIVTSGNGSILRSPDQSGYTAGSNVTFTATPAPGWVFDHWEGDLAGSANPMTLTVPANQTVIAVFVSEPIIIIVD